MKALSHLEHHLLVFKSLTPMKQFLVCQLKNILMMLQVQTDLIKEQCFVDQFLNAAISFVKYITKFSIEMWYKYRLAFEVSMPE